MHSGKSGLLLIIVALAAILPASLAQAYNDRAEIKEITFNPLQPEKSSDLGVNVTVRNSGSASTTVRVEVSMKDANPKVVSDGKSRIIAAGSDWQFAFPKFIDSANNGWSGFEDSRPYTVVAVLKSCDPDCGHGKFIASAEKSFFLKTPKANVPEINPLFVLVLGFFALLFISRKK